MKTPLLLGIITALLFGSFAMSGMFAQAGMGGLVVSEVRGATTTAFEGNGPVPGVAQCPPGTQLLGGNYDMRVRAADNSNPGLQQDYDVFSLSDFPNNRYTLAAQVFATTTAGTTIDVTPIAFCATLTFPMGMSMVGGELLDIDTMALFIGAIGVNPVITGLVGITMGGVAAQVVWFVHSRRKKNE